MTFGTLIMVTAGFYAGCVGYVRSTSNPWFLPQPRACVEISCKIHDKLLTTVIGTQIYRKYPQKNTTPG